MQLKQTCRRVKELCRRVKELYDRIKPLQKPTTIPVSRAAYGLQAFKKTSENLSQELYDSVKELCDSAKELYGSAKELYDAVKELYDIFPVTPYRCEVFYG